MSAPGLRSTESEISSTRPDAAATSTALPMRASLNIETTACLALLQICAARRISIWVLVGPRSRSGGGGNSGETTCSGGMASSALKSVAMRSSTSSGDRAGLPAATSLPRETSIQTSCTAVL